MRVWMVRHGESETNRSKVWTGWYDAPLTEKGKEDAVRAGAFLAGIDFDIVFSSDLSRAKTTAEIALPGCSLTFSSKLREWNVGSLSLKPLSVLTENDRIVIAKEGYGIFGGESKEEFLFRVKSFMEELELLECGNVAVFTHAGFLRRFLNAVLATELPSRNIACANCATAVFDYKNGLWQLNSWINLQ